MNRFRDLGEDPATSSEKVPVDSRERRALYLLNDTNK